MGIVIVSLAALCAVGLVVAVLAVVVRRRRYARSTAVSTRDGTSQPVADVLEPYHRGQSGQVKMPVSVAVRMRAAQADPGPDPCPQ